MGNQGGGTTRSGRCIKLLVVVYGGGVLAGQVIILREVLVLCQGQELKLALGLWCWLMCTGIGSLVGGRMTRGRVPGISHMGGLLALLGVILPATVITARLLPFLAWLPPGQSLPVQTAIVLFLILLAPFGLVSGVFFPLACQTLRATSPLAGSAGRIYTLETLGSGLGVCLVQILLAGRYDSLAVGMGAGAVLIISAWLLSLPHSRLGHGGYVVSLTVLLAAGILFSALDKQCGRTARWPRQMLASVDSPYARLSASREGEQVSFFANNVWQFTVPDPYHAEHGVHLGLAQHPQPHEVLLLGGGVGGLAREILKIKGLRRLDYVELDPELVRLAKRLLPPEATGFSQDPRVEIIHQDARRFLTETQRRYDVILMNLPEPTSAQLNRFYTQEFFQSAARHLYPQGVFGFSLPGAETSLNPWRAAYLALSLNTLRQVFPEVAVLPGDRLRFFAALTAGTLIREPEAITARLEERRVELQYVREYYLRYDLSPQRREFVEEILNRQAVEINTDLNPRSYFYDLALTGAREGLPLREFLQTMKNLPGALLGAGVIIAALLLLLVRGRGAGVPYLTQVVVMGVGTMGLEILVIILYQINWGALYQQLGLLIAAFMGGMGLGGAWGVHLAGKGQARRWHLAGLQAGLGVLALLTAGVFSGAVGLAWQPGEWMAMAGYLLIMALAGGGGGAIFAVSAQLWYQSSAATAWKDGMLYAADLAGATLGILGCSLLVIPVWGIVAGLCTLAGVHLLAALLLV